MIFYIVNEQVRQNAFRELSSLPLGFMVNFGEIKRSLQQNSLYWDWVDIIAKELGFDKDEMHESFKRQFIGEDHGVDVFGNHYSKPKSSAKLKKKEFSKYMLKVEVFAMSMNIILPKPDYYGMEKDLINR